MGEMAPKILEKVALDPLIRLHVKQEQQEDYMAKNMQFINQLKSSQ